MIYKYFVLILINIIGGKYLSTAYAVAYKLNPADSIILITISESIVCIALFYIGMRFKEFSFFTKLTHSKRANKAYSYIDKYGHIIGFFIGQFFIGAPLISLAVGFLYKKDKNIYFYFFLPMFVSVFLYAIFNFYLSISTISYFKKLFVLFR